MNERIRELYQRAHIVREYSADDPMRGGNPPTVYWGGEESAKKFAELIIQKCAMIGNYAYDDGEYPGKMIKEYFGVKE